MRARSPALLLLSQVARQKLMDHIMDYYHEERVLALRCQQEMLSAVILKPELLPGQGQPEYMERRKMIRYIAEGTVNLFENNPLAAEINRQLSLKTAAVAAAETAKVAPNAPMGDPFASLGIGAATGPDPNAFGTSKKAAKSSLSKGQTAASQKQLLNEGQRMRWAAQVLKERKECMQVLLLFRQLKDMSGDPGYDPEQDASKFYREHEQNLMYGNFDILLGPLLTDLSALYLVCAVACALRIYPCVLGADWRLRSDGMTNSHLQGRCHRPPLRPARGAIRQQRGAADDAAARDGCRIPPDYPLFPGLCVHGDAAACAGQRHRCPILRDDERAR